MTLTIEQLPILQDNYCPIIHDGTKACVIDPGDAEPVQLFLRERTLDLAAILNTHHHGDHTAGNEALVDLYGCPVYAPKAEMEKIKSATHGVEEGDEIEFAGVKFQVLETPGHTLGHIIYVCRDLKAVFCGDTLFSMGCGRLFEGTPEQMFESFKKLERLPIDMVAYCGHEYTATNSKFTSENSEVITSAMQDRFEEVERLRRSGQPTLPVLLKTELDTNLFLKASSVEEFAQLRKIRDKY